MNAVCDLRNAILIHRLPDVLQKAGAQALAESISIPHESVTLMKSDHWGVKVILDNETNFKKTMLKGFLEVSNKVYLVYPVVTDLAICGAGPNVDEAMVTSLLKPFAPVLLVYRERNVWNRTSTRNFRGVLFHPEIPEEIRKWTWIKLKSGAIDNTELSITFFCRFCRQYGHTRHECNTVKLQNSLNERNAINIVQFSDKSTEDSPVICCTDVSKIDGRVGFAFVVFRSGVESENFQFRIPQRYVDDILLPFLLQFPGLIFQQDNAKPYTTRVAMNCLTANQTLSWLARLPNPSPFEHVWDMMGRLLHPPGNVDDQGEQIWQEILQETIRVLY
ncbi:uncharacterized protein TNCV_2767981 [Trichonephila clavipes]|nr:uncharacterized protein TNCV_2767981 [Trichonephila clavipes]